MVSFQYRKLFKILPKVISDLIDSKKLIEMTLDELKIIQFEFKSILFESN